MIIKKADIKTPNIFTEVHRQTIDEVGNSQLWKLNKVFGNSGSYQIGIYPKDLNGELIPYAKDFAGLEVKLKVETKDFTEQTYPKVAFQQRDEITFKSKIDYVMKDGKKVFDNKAFDKVVVSFRKKGDSKWFWEKLDQYESEPTWFFKKRFTGFGEYEYKIHIQNDGTDIFVSEIGSISIKELMKIESLSVTPNTIVPKKQKLTATMSGSLFGDCKMKFRVRVYDLNDGFRGTILEDEEFRDLKTGDLNIVAEKNSVSSADGQYQVRFEYLLDGETDWHIVGNEPFEVKKFDWKITDDVIVGQTGVDFEITCRDASFNHSLYTGKITLYPPDGQDAVKVDMNLDDENKVFYHHQGTLSQAGYYKVVFHLFNRDGDVFATKTKWLLVGFGNDCDNIARPGIVPREEWCTVDCDVDHSGQNFDKTEVKYDFIAIHHSKTPNSKYESYVHRFDRNPEAEVDWKSRLRQMKTGGGHKDVSYNYVIDPNGIIYQGRRNLLRKPEEGIEKEVVSYGLEDLITRHTIDVCLIGNFHEPNYDGTYTRPTDAAIISLKSLVTWLCNQYKMDPIGTNEFTENVYDKNYNKWYSGEVSIPTITTHTEVYKSLRGAKYENVNINNDYIILSSPCPGQYFFEKIDMGDFRQSIPYCSSKKSLKFEEKSIESLSVVYPNPVEDILNFDIEKASTVEVYSIKGYLVATKIGSNLRNISLSHLPKGIYLIRVSNHEKIITNKIIKK